jgi:toxin ParE1/3/4
MKVVIDAAAFDDLNRIHAWIARDRPAAAGQVIDRIFKSVENLGLFPFMGHEGKVPKTYEWVVRGLPYIVVYEVSIERDELIVAGVFHGAQDR